MQMPTFSGLDAQKRAADQYDAYTPPMQDHTPQKPTAQKKHQVPVENQFYIASMPSIGAWATTFHFLPKLVVAVVLLYCVIMLAHNAHETADLRREVRECSCAENKTVPADGDMGLSPWDRRSVDDEIKRDQDTYTEAVLLETEAVINPHRKPREQNGMLDVRKNILPGGVIVYTYKMDRVKGTRYPERGLSLESTQVSQLLWMSMCCRTGTGAVECTGNVRMVDDQELKEKFVELHYSRPFPVSCTLTYAITTSPEEHASKG